jgi:hypothetical protein
MSTTKNILGALSDAGQIISIGIPVAGQVIPLAIGLVKEIRSIATGAETVDYQILIQTDGAELDAIHKLAEDDISAINAELEKLGQPPISTDPPATPPPAAA